MELALYLRILFCSCFTVSCDTFWMYSVPFGNSESCKNCWQSGASWHTRSLTTVLSLSRPILQEVMFHHVVRVAVIKIKNHEFLMGFKELLWISFCVSHAIKQWIFAPSSLLTTLFRCALSHPSTISCRHFSLCLTVNYVCFFGHPVFIRFFN